MMHSVSKAQDNDIGKDTLRFIKHKYLSFAPTLIASALVITVTTTIIFRPSIKGIIIDTITLFPEIIPLQIAGIRGNYITTVAWYLSAMMLALFVLYPVARRTDTKFTRIICPLLTAMIYGIICHEYGNLNTITGEYFLIPIQSGFFRAIAGICTGCMLYDCVKATAHYKTTRFGEICFLGAELTSLIVIFGFAQFFPETYFDFFTLPSFFILLYSYFGRKSIYSKRFSFSFTKHLGTASLIIYLNHNSWNFFKDFFNRPTLKENFLLYAAMVTFSCIAVALLTPLLRLIWKKSKVFLKKHFVG